MTVSAKIEKLRYAGWDIQSLNFADIILESEFPEQTDILLDTLLQTNFDIEQSIIKSGGGLATQTQALASRFNEIGKKNVVKIFREIVFTGTFRNISSEDSSHEIDHLCQNSENQFLAIEIEWNNKDEFYDRDFQSLKRLYEAHIIEAGIIVTRGTSLEGALLPMVEKYFSDYSVNSVADFEVIKERFPNPKDPEDFAFSFPTPKQILRIKKKVLSGKSFARASAEVFKADKFTGTTTNWRQLQKRIERRDGGRTPILCIGIPSSVFST